MSEKPYLSVHKSTYSTRLSSLVATIENLPWNFLGEGFLYVIVILRIAEFLAAAETVARDVIFSYIKKPPSIFQHRRFRL